MFDFLKEKKKKKVKLINFWSIFPFHNPETVTPRVFLGEGVLKICSKFTREHPCQSVISIKVLCNFIEITLWHGCSLVNLLHIFRTSFYKNTCGGLLLTPKNTRFSGAFRGYNMQTLTRDGLKKLNLLQRDHSVNQMVLVLIESKKQL